LIARSTTEPDDCNARQLRKRGRSDCRRAL
jgi:hypothetical protein